MKQAMQAISWIPTITQPVIRNTLEKASAELEKKDVYIYNFDWDISNAALVERIAR